MNRTAQNRSLMRRLGFVADPRTKPQIVPHDRATYWRHQPILPLVRPIDIAHPGNPHETRVEARHGDRGSRQVRP